MEQENSARANICLDSLLLGGSPLCAAINATWCVISCYQPVSLFSWSHSSETEANKTQSHLIEYRSQLVLLCFGKFLQNINNLLKYLFVKLNSKTILILDITRMIFCTEIDYFYCNYI